MSKKMDPWYVTGFCDGEAAFTYSRGKDSICAYFAIRLRKDNTILLEKIQDFFGGIGKLYFSKEALPKRYSGHTKEAVYYRVSKVDDLKQVVEHFDKHPIMSNKHAAYLAWKELVLYKRQHYGRVDMKQLEQLASRVSELNQKGKMQKSEETSNA